MDTQSSGLGGGHFMTIFNASTRKCHSIDAREAAPLAASENMYRNRWNRSRYGWEAVGVPGELHGMWTEYKNFGGILPWNSLVQPTIDLMKEGYPTSHELAKSLKHHRKQIFKDSLLKRCFINPLTGDVYKTGEQITTRKNMIKTLEKLAEAEDPAKEFYQGEMAMEMVKEFEKNGGLITQDDLTRYKAIIRADSDVIYTKLSNGLRICGPPPPSGSAVTQAIIKAMEGQIPADLNTVDDFVAFYHNFIETSKFAYGERSWLGDMDFVQDALKLAKNITTDRWAETVRPKIRPTVQPDSYYGGNYTLPGDHGTTHINVIDRWGNAVSVTSTINLILGAQVISESTGILFNDEMDDFSLPGHPNSFHYPPSPSNFIRPGKRPMSSMSPLVIFDAEGKELMSIGGAGGSTIISGVAAVALQALRLQLNIKEAVDRPRLHNQLRPNVTNYEANLPKEYIDALRTRGHTFAKPDEIAVVTAVHLANGTVYANSDFRKGVESGPAGY